MDDVSHRSRSVSVGKAQSTCAQQTESSAKPSSDVTECKNCGHGLTMRAYFYRRRNGVYEGRIFCTTCNQLFQRVPKTHSLLVGRSPDGTIQKELFID